MEHSQRFGVHRGRILPDGFRSELVKLPVTSRRRTLPPEHGAEIIKLLERAEGVAFVLQEKPHRRGGPFRPQGKLPPSTVSEGGHFFRDNIGILSHPPGEQFAVLEDGRAYFPIPIIFHYLSGYGFDMTPGRRVFRQNIVSPFGGGESI